MATANDVAAYVMQQLRRPCSTMKLQKLLYYSQGWSLAWDGAPIFDDPIEAWANGPVVPTVFRHHRGRFRVDPPEWTFGDVDALTDDPTCAWSWHLEPCDLKELLDFLGDMAGRTWGEIESDRTGVRGRHKKHHDMHVDVLPACARNRFANHMSTVSDESYQALFRFRYGGKKRLWGIRDRALFRVLWVDLDHAVYPTDK